MSAEGFLNDGGSGIGRWIGLLVTLALLGACTNPQVAVRNERAIIAKALFEERCKKAGVFIHRTVQGVEGILVMKLRPRDINYGSQFVMDDPYGSDLGGDGYLESLLRGSFQATPGSPARLGYRYVEAVDPADGQRYRYTGSVRDYVVTPNAAFSSSSKPFTTRGFVMDKVPAPGPAPRYGVTYDDISTRADREYWIAGSSLRVIDTETGEILAERIGYMWDAGQGSDAGGRSPWLFATDNACPGFVVQEKPTSSRHGSVKQLHQTLKFVIQVLVPTP